MRKNIRVLLVYKNFAAWQGISHIGLGVSAEMSAQYLNAHGISAEVLAARNNIDVVDFLKKNPGITDVVISAFWLSIVDMESMCRYFKDIRFIVVSHSNVGFLQADPGAFMLLRRYISLSRELSNFKIGANCKKFEEWLSVAYDIRVTALTNLYPVALYVKEKRSDGLVKIGSFGAIRPQKNVLSAAAAALYIHMKMRVPVEFSLSTGREDGGGATILRAVREMCGSIPGFFLVERFWSDWRAFRRVIRGQDILIHVSYTESFNMVTADGIAEGVPSVISPAIAWAPKSWKVDPDNVREIAERGIEMLDRTRHEVESGYSALRDNNEDGFEGWKAYLEQAL